MVPGTARAGTFCCADGAAEEVFQGSDMVSARDGAGEEAGGVAKAYWVRLLREQECESSTRYARARAARAWRLVPVKPLDAGLPPKKLLALREIRGVTKSFILFKEPSYCLPMMYRSAALVVSPDR